MKAVVSYTGIEVLYPCVIHLFNQNEVIECEYQSGNTGKDLLYFVCDYMKLENKDYWGFKYFDIYNQRHWLENNKLIKTQIKDICPVHFYFAVRVYPPQPYRLTDAKSKHQIFMQIRLDLANGRLCCNPSDVALLLGLMLQYKYGDYDASKHEDNYAKDKIVYSQTVTSELKAIDLHKCHLKGMNKAQTEDFFLRMTSQMETYGVDPYLVEDISKQKLTLWINYKGMITYKDSKIIHHLEWMAINRIKYEKCHLIIDISSSDTVVFVCLTEAECNYIYIGAIAHLYYFTNSGNKCNSTTGTMGSDAEEIEELTSDEYDAKNNNGPVFKQSDGFIDKNDIKLKGVNIWRSMTFWHIILIVIFVGVFTKYTVEGNQMFQDVIIVN